VAKLVLMVSLKPHKRKHGPHTRQTRILCSYL